MTLLKVVVLTVLAVAIQAGVVPISYSHSPVLSYSHAPLVSYSHAPVVSYSHAPVAVQDAHIDVEVDHYATPHYEFKYGVHDGHTHDIKEQAEKRVGDKVEGYYSLVEPDGTKRTVHYTADKHTGFNAVVTKSGHAIHPSAPIKVAVPVHNVVAAPVLTYSHAAPVHSYNLGGYH